MALGWVQDTGVSPGGVWRWLGEQAAPLGFSFALALPHGAQGGAGGLHEDVGDVLLVLGRALEVGDSVHLPGHGLCLQQGSGVRPTEGRGLGRGWGPC